MKNLKSLLIIGISMCSIAASAQNIEHQIVASQYGAYQVPTVGQGYSFPPASCQIAAAGKNFPAFARTVPIKIVDSNPAQIEVVTPVAVNVNNNNCSVSMNTTYSHISFYLTSGTGGLQESLNAGQVTGGANTVILDQQWYSQVAPSTPATVIAAVKGTTALGIVDVTTTPYAYYAWNGTNYAQTATGGGTTTNSVTFNNSGSGAASGTAFNGTTAQTISTNTIGAAPINSPTFTGTPSAPTQAVSTNSTALATTQAVTTALVPYATLASPSFTGTVTAPTVAITTNNTQLATTSAVNSALLGLAPLNSPNFTGVPTVPTATVGTNTTQAASTAFVLQNTGTGPPTGTAGGGLSGTYPSPNVAGTLSVMNYGAVCNWNGTTGTDDSTAFQAAITAAAAVYTAKGAPVTVAVPYGCTLGSVTGQTTINVPSGVHLEGPGTIFVPAQSANPLFLATSASDVTWDQLTITFVSNLTACGPTLNNALCSAIRWDGNPSGTGTAYKRVNATNNTIINSGWGITIIAQAGLDTLSDVHVDGNTVMESQVPTTSYQYADGIHVGGAVTGVTINHNIVTGRSDAGIAVTSESSSGPRLCSNVAIVGNTLYEDRIGIDDSGCSSLQVSGNQVHADITTATSNPAFRSIYYNGLPTNVNVMGNNFENYQGSGTDVSAKYDCAGGCGNGTGTGVNAFNSKFTGNKVFSMYVRGSGIDFSGNTFEPGGLFDLDWDTTGSNFSLNDTIGQNSWQGTGTFSNDSRSDVYAGDKLAPQVSIGTLTFTHPGEISSIPATYSSIIDTGLTAGTSPVCPNGTGGALTTSGCSGGGGGGVTSINATASGAVTVAGTGGTTVSTAGSTITVSSSSSGGVSNANFMFVGDSITCGLYSSSSCANLGPGAGTPVVTNSTGYSAVTTGTASSGSTTLTVASATGIINGEVVVGVGIPLGTFETISGTTVTLSQATTAALSTTAVSFGLMDYPAQAMRLGALTGNSNTGINAGVSGWRSDQIISAYTTIVHPYAPSVTGKAGYLFVMIGTNDLLQGVPYATTVANLTAYWQTAHNDGWKVIALTIPNGPWGANSWQQWINLNQYIRQNATQWDRLIDEATVLSNNYDNTLWQTDHIHPINGGYSILAGLINQSVATSGSVLPTEQILPWSSGYGDIFYPVITGGLVTTGFYDAAFGILAFQQATNDYQDTAIGASALALANGSHDDTAVGHYTQGNVSTGTSNSSLGSFACNGITTGSGNTCLGANADVSAGGSSGRVQLGQGTNATDNTMQFDGFNFLTSAGLGTFSNVKDSGLLGAATVATDSSGNLIAGLGGTVPALYSGSVTYAAGQIAYDGSGNNYSSLASGNVGNALTNATFWHFLGGVSSTITGGNCVTAGQFMTGISTSGVPVCNPLSAFVSGSQALYLPYQQGTTSATTITDYSGNSRTGTFGTGGSAPSWLSSGAGIACTADQYIVIPSGVLNGAGTIQMWFALSNPQYNDVAGIGPEIMLSDSNNMNIATEGAYNGQVFTASGSSQPNARGTDRFVNNSGVTFTYNGSTILEYIDGRPVSGYLPAVSGSSAISWTGSSSGNICNLAANAGYGASMTFYGMAVYSTVLTPTQIAANDSAFKSLIKSTAGVSFPTFQPPSVWIAQGDSRIIDYPEYGNTNSTPYLALHSFGVDNYNDLGVGGQTQATAYTNIANREYPLLDGNSTGVRVVWNESATNDIASGTAAATVVTSLQNYCSALHTRYPGIKVIVNTPPPRSDESTGDETARQTLVSTLVSDWLGGTLGCDGLADEGEDMLAVNSTSPNPFSATSTYNATYYRDGVHYQPVLAQELASQDACSVQDVLGRMNQPCWIHKTIPYTALSEYGAVTSKVATFLQLGPNWQVCGVKEKVGSAFVGTSISALTLTIGDSTGTATQYLGSQSLLATGAAMAQAPNYVSTHGIVQGTFAATGANLSALTAGSMSVDICVVDVP